MSVSKKYTVEKWKSNKKGREDHIFADPERRVYFFGYNPDLISKKKLAAIFKILGVTQ